MGKEKYQKSRGKGTEKEQRWYRKKIRKGTKKREQK
jgi:hypothetical protein